MKSVIKGMVLTIVFIASLFTFSILKNQVNESQTGEMEASTLPILYFEQGGTLMNETHGYTGKMELTKVRDTITPLDSDHKLHLTIDATDAVLDRISYQLWDITGTDMIDEQNKILFQRTEDTITTTIELPEIETETEYIAVITLKTNRRDVCYYTRVIDAQTWNIRQCLSFAQDFHNHTFTKTNTSYFRDFQLAEGMNNGDFALVDLECSTAQIAWGLLEVEQMTPSRISLMETNNSYNVVTIDYVMSYLTPEEVTEYYNVEEYFRLRYSDNHMYVLEYERRTNHIFDEHKTFLTEDGNILLGIRDNDCEYLSNESGSVVTFVQEGSLFSYNINNSTISRIFSFDSGDPTDLRSNYVEHDIDIVRVDDVGNIDFFVYGYMNRGEHEGEVGLALYHYDSLMYTIEEQAYMPSGSSFDIMRQDVGQMMYENDHKQLFLMNRDKMCRINLEDRSVTTIAQGLTDNNYVISENGRVAAWYYESEPNVIHMLDMKENKEWQLEEGEGTRIIPLAFLNEDFVYGIAELKDMVLDSSGIATFPYRSIRIVSSDENHEVIKTYSPAGKYISNVLADRAVLHIDLLQKSENGYTPAGTDAILDKDGEKPEIVYPSSFHISGKLLQKTLIMAKTNTARRVKELKANSILLEETPFVEMPETSDAENYYVYSRGHMTMLSADLSTAIAAANESMGVVVDEKQEYIWKRARQSYRLAFDNIRPNEADREADSLTRCLSAILHYEGKDTSAAALLQSGRTAGEILRSQIPGAQTIELSGCSSEDILYYVSEGYPVVAMTGNNSAMLIIGYNYYQVFCYDPESGGLEKIAFTRADQIFANGGMRFLSYLK